MLEPLRDQLIKLARELQKDNLRLIIGGGYGLLLRTEHIITTGPRTRFDEMPVARSTNDLDLFLSIEIITSSDKMAAIRKALDTLGFEPIDGVKYYQFYLPINYEGLDKVIKIDLLAPLPTSEEQLKVVKKDIRRIRPRGFNQLHAHVTEEAVTLEEQLISIDISSGTAPVEVYLPHPFTNIVLKLFALRDRLEDEAKMFGAYHAFDIYRTIGMMTETEWEESKVLVKKYAGSTKIQEAADIVQQLFSDFDALGIQRIREHARQEGEDVSDVNIQKVLDDLREIFLTH